MAKNNKYASINFNHIYDKTITTTTTTSNSPSLSPSHSSSASYSSISNPNKPHGRILVLTRPTPKPKPKPVLTSSPSPPPQLPQPPNPVQPPRSEPGSDLISLRPLGRTGTGSSVSLPLMNHDKDKGLLQPPPASSKPDKFVPPHLRPGFVPREERPGPEPVRSRDAAHHRQQGHDGYPGRVGQDERMRRGGGLDMGLLGRPRSGGNRPSSSGWDGGAWLRMCTAVFGGITIRNGYEDPVFTEDKDKHVSPQIWVL